MAIQFLRLPTVCSRTGLKRAQLYRLMGNGQFPRPIKLAERSAAWLESDVVAWQEERIAASRQGEAAQ